MSFRPFLLSAIALIVLDGGPQNGRKGNELYQEGKYAEAAGTYRAGLDGLPATPGTVRFGLLNNLGAALFRTQSFAEAQEAFNHAIAAAVDPMEGARAAYNAGNTAYATQALEEALKYYTSALLANPENEDAKFNYEFVKRKLEEQKQDQQQQSQGRSTDQQDQQQDQKQDGQGNSNQQNQQDQNQDQQQPEQQQDQDQQDQNNQAGKDQQQGQQEEPQQAESSQPRPDEMSREQAERILQALQNDEEELLRDTQKLKGRPGVVEKDW